MAEVAMTEIIDICKYDSYCYDGVLYEYTSRYVNEGMTHINLCTLCDSVTSFIWKFQWVCNYVCIELYTSFSGAVFLHTGQRTQDFC